MTDLLFSIVIQIIILVLVMILYSKINDFDEKSYNESISENNSSSPKAKQLAESARLNAINGPVLYEPVLILDILY